MPIQIPWPANSLAIFLVFAACVLVFHVLFLFVMPLGKVGWKKTDYAWLIIGVIGLLATTGKLRREIANNYLQQAEGRLTFAYELLKERTAYFVGPAICREFVRTEFSPKNFDEVQKEFDTVCAFGKTAVGSLPDTMPENPNDLDLSTLKSKRPTITHKGLVDDFKSLDNAIANFENAIATVNSLSKHRGLNNFPIFRLGGWLDDVIPQR